MTTMESLAAHYNDVRKRLDSTPQKVVEVAPKVAEVALDPRMKIICEVARAHGTTADILRSKADTYRLRGARREAYRRLRDERGMSLPRIGRFMGGRHHTTILSALNGRRESSPRAATVG
jgi:chromosomal replication initiation ATPase DnaA